MDTDNEEPKVEYPVPEPEYLHLPHSLIEGLHTELPNPFYEQLLKDAEERQDYAHPTDAIIRSIVAQYGPFNEITEESLMKMESGDDEPSEHGGSVSVDAKDIDMEGEDIAKDSLNSNGDVLVQDMDDAETTEQEFELEKEFYEKRDKMLTTVRSALGHSTVALDLVSLLLSGVRPSAGSSSVSEHLKQNLKMGSLSAVRIEPVTTDSNTQKTKENLEDMTVGRGWKIESLSKSSSFVRDSASRLKNKIEQEKNYWNDVLDVIKANELVTSVSIPTRNKASGQPKKSLAVKYGFGDSGSEYFDKGIALLEKSSKNNGHLEFVKVDQGEREKIWGGEKIVGIKIFHKSGKLLGKSDSYGVLQNATIKEDATFVHKVKNSRFFIFENELFWHLMKEAVSLVNIQVTVHDFTIKIDLGSYYMEIENIGITSDEAQTPTEELPLNERADNILKFFRILLCANNYRNLKKLDVPPVALGKESSSSKAKQGFLIRPFIMYSKHNALIHELCDAVSSLVPESQISIEKYTNDPNNHNAPKQTDSKETVTSSGKLFNNDPFTRVYAKLSPTSRITFTTSNLTISIELVSSYSTFHNTINVDLAKTETGEKVLSSTYHYKKDLQDCLSWALRQYV